MDYVERKSRRVNLLAAAREAGMTASRFRRFIQHLKIPIERSGWNVLVERSAIARVRAAVHAKVLRPGRPKKKARR